MTTELQSLPLVQDITLVQGGDWHETINLFEDDQVTPKDTTGYTAEMTIFSSPNGETYDTLTIANGKITHTPASGQFNLDLTAAQIAEYDFTSAQRKFIITTDTGGKVPLIIGSVQVR
jgi:hypothetical protein